ncbi:MAG: hypothetical protein JWP32_2360 [Schumannella sp.]|nr:hypothetical protein [Schumannella sp.]
MRIHSQHARRSAVAVVLASAFVLTGCSAATPDSADTGGGGDAAFNDAATVAYLAPSATVTRWATQDIPDYVSTMSELAPNVEVLTFEAGDSVSTQLQQAKSAITQGATVLLVSAVSAEQSAGLVSYANANGASVIAMTRSINNADTAGMVGDDPTQIGVELANYIVEQTKDGDTIATVWGDATDTFAVRERDGAMSVLQPLIDSGKRTVVGDQNTTGWLPDNAQKLMDAILLQNDNKIDAVIVANDDMAGGVRASLDKAGVGDIPITGIDATLPGVRAILQGNLAVTIFRSFQDQADIAAQATVHLLKGEALPDSLFPETVDNGLKEIPFASVPSTAITIDNVQLLIDQGVYTKDEICEGIPAGTGPC